MIRHGTRDFRRTNLGLFAAGVSTFGLLYCVQPLMPVFSDYFRVSAASGALSLSLSSAGVAVGLLFAGDLSDRWGRKRVMTVSLISSAVVMLLTAFAPNWSTLLVLRALVGLTLSGLPAVAMTYLAEEIHADSIGLGMGLYISGNAVGGLAGRLAAGGMTDLFGWRVGIATVAAMAAIAAAVFVSCLPSSKNFQPRLLPMAHLRARYRSVFTDAGLPWLFAEGGVLLGSFVTVYNYTSYRLMAPPFNLGQTAVGAIFSVYFLGMLSSIFVGDLAGRLGRRKVLWPTFTIMLCGLGLTMLPSVWGVGVGIATLTVGFFAAHSVASSWVGRRGGAAKAQANSVYLFCYYAGAGIAGASGGLFYQSGGWREVALFVATLLLIGQAIAIRLYFLAPLPIPQRPAEEPQIPT